MKTLVFFYLLANLAFLVLLGCSFPRDLQVTEDYATLVKITEVHRYGRPDEWVLSWKLDSGETVSEYVKAVRYRLQQRIKVLR